VSWNNFVAAAAAAAADVGRLRQGTF